MTQPTLFDCLRVFGQIGLVSFGGPAAQIALMHDVLVSRKKWLSEQQFLRALSLCMLLPGPEAMQLATYAGWRLHGVAGGLLAGLLFVGPGAVLILWLAMAYVHYGEVPWVQAAFLGIKAAVIVIVMQALWRLGAKALSGRTAWVLAGLSFVALFVFGLPFPAIVIAAGVFGAITSGAMSQDAPPAPIVRLSLRPVFVTALIWAAPLILLWLTGAGFLLDIGLFFSKLAIVSFGGAYSVVAYMTQEAVQGFGWLSTGQMIDALGLAETTPGPLILVTEFVALLAGYAQGGIVTALAAGALTLWVTFVPCFLWIFAAAPYLDAIATRTRLSNALNAITAAIVGIILNLSVWFALHVFFGTVSDTRALALPVPDLATICLPAVVLTGVAGFLLVRLNMHLLKALVILAIFGVIIGTYAPV